MFDVSPRKNQPNNKAEIGSKNKKGETLLAESIFIDELCEASHNSSYGKLIVMRS